MSEGPTGAVGASEVGAGTRLNGRYEVLAPISRGAMGSVVRARDERFGVEVAVKQLLDSSQLARFEIEARLLSQLDHPNIVKVTDHFTDEHGCFLVMELVAGSDLREVLAQEGSPGLGCDPALDLSAELCAALNYVHHQGIVHRDVKLDNAIRGPAGVVLVDFGVARELADERAGTIAIGTPRFMAPEVFAGGAASERSDVFSLAVTVWALLTGAPPAYGSAPSLRDRCPEAPAELARALAAGLEFAPERRIPSVAAFAEAIGRPLGPEVGVELVASVSGPHRRLLEAIVRTAAGVFDAAAASIALSEGSGELVYQAAWGDGAREIVGVRLERGQGIAGSVVAGGEALVVAECRSDPRFAARVAAGTGYVPNTMVVVPLLRDGHAIGALSILDRRDGNAYTPADVTRAALFAELALQVLEH
jgi:putative methionine-R-sulfoxide reductase with GAF domain